MHLSRPRTRRGSASGLRQAMTLIELIVVVAIVATLAGIVAPAIMRNVGDSRVAAARAQIDVLELALDSYRIDMGQYPSTVEGLSALRTPPGGARASARWRGPYLRRDVPLDPWGRPYEYRFPGRENRDGLDLYTLGRDGVVGGSAEDADITNWGLPGADQ